MDITWLGRSCFRLQSGGVSILTDPFDLPGDPPSEALARLLAPPDIVTLSRRTARDRLAVRGAYRILDGPGEYEIKGVPITGIATSVAPPAPPAAQEGRPARNVVYSILLDGVTVCHLGRLDQPLAAQQLQEVGTPDVLLLPVGEPAGLPVPRAVELANQLEARLLVPVTVGGTQDGAVERFCRELGADAANFVPRLTVTSSGLPAQVQVARLVPVVPPGHAPDPVLPEPT